MCWRQTCNFTLMFRLKHRKVAVWQLAFQSMFKQRISLHWYASSNSLLRLEFSIWLQFCIGEKIFLNICSCSEFYCDVRPDPGRLVIVHQQISKLYSFVLSAIRQLFTYYCLRPSAKDQGITWVDVVLHHLVHFLIKRNFNEKISARPRLELRTFCSAINCSTNWAT